MVCFLVKCGLLFQSHDCGFFYGLFFRLQQFKLEKFKCHIYRSHVRPCGLAGLVGLVGLLFRHTLNYGLNHDGVLASCEKASHHLWEENLGNRSLRLCS